LILDLEYFFIVTSSFCCSYFIFGFHFFSFFIFFFSPSAFLVFSIPSYISCCSAPYIFSPFLASTVAGTSASADAGSTG
jgi:hypothetical protein